ncbi:hypothetical protein PVAND_004011 [Polypedilum vanderplanki]|uniref:Protein kinase domain-containing protein n=1 Tax=Polypedilum vanderplanki TaxID=319348 RepID=A0A9J6BWC2_POLVA|nr:hypothetical protein PVAND_004011 [Polypedilum vanderplanki]
MGLIGWIKKEIESNSRHRRQSAPLPIIHSLNSTNGNRDEAYLRAVAKFNEWRNSQRFERLNETNNASAITQEIISKTTADDISITDVEVEENERKRLKHMHSHESKKKHHQHAVYSNLNPANSNEKNKCLSLPIMKNDQSKRHKIIKIQPSSTIDEIEEFEQNHCKNFEDFSFAIPSTPPQKFYRNNTEPYDGIKVVEKKNKTETRKPTPKRLMGRNMLRRSKGKAPQPPQTQTTNAANQSDVDGASESTMNFINGNFKHYDVSSASILDDFIISSRAYKGNLRKEYPEKINSVGESASSGSLTSESEKNVIKQQRRLSPPYQTIINKHGDEVEYALPYNERDSMLDIPPIPETPMPSSNERRQCETQFDHIIDQNFKFLNSKIDFLNSQIDSGNTNHKSIDLIDASFSDIRRQNLQVTDLDKSNETGLAFPVLSGDIESDLNALTKWTENCKKDEAEKEEEIIPAMKYANKKGSKKINSNDLRYKPGSLRNSFSTPLEFSNGYYHKTPITLRSTLPNNYNINNFADTACMHEFEILCQVKHYSIATLMGISFDLDLRITSLVMEPFDYTLNHYLHQMDKFYNIQQTISIVHQITNAVQYLHECGFVHSNISSHAILIRDQPFAVKLSSFELATEILPTEAIGKIYHLNNINENIEIFTLETHDKAQIEKYSKLSKQHFYNRTSLPIMHLSLSEYDDENEYRQPYSIPYRRMFSMHYYQAPELLVPTNNVENVHVFPSISSDIYGLGLLLWELINRVVPYVIYDNDDLISGLKRGKIQLPMFDKSSIIFKEIFQNCLHVNNSKRLSDVTDFIKMLEDLRLLSYEKDKIEILEIIEPTNEQKIEKNIKNYDQRDKLREKIYFSNAETDIQKRHENALTNKNLVIIGDTSKVSESVQSTDIEPQLDSFVQPPGILQEDALERIRKTVEDQRGITPKKPLRQKDEDNHHQQQQQHDISKNSTMFQSFFDLNRLQTPKVDKDVIYERTSTLKKRLKFDGPKSGQKKSVKGLFENNDDDFVEKKKLQDQLDKMNAELNMIVQDYNKNDFMQEIVEELKNRENTNGRSSDFKATAFLNQHVPDSKNSAHDLSGSFEEVVEKKRHNNASDVKPNHQRRYSSDDSFSLPNTPIARQNMIRRNAWLSDDRKTTTTCVSDEIARRSINFINNSTSHVNDEQKYLKSNKKQYNVNIKIHHNDLDTATTPKDKSTNINQSHNNSSVKIKLYNSTNNPTPIIKINNIDLNKTSYSEDINKKYYPMMPEMLSDVIQNKRDRSSFSIIFPHDEINPKQTALPKKSLSFSDDHIRNKNVAVDDEENVIVSQPMSVRDTIKLIEKTYNISKTETIQSEKFIRRNEETQVEGCQMKSNQNEQTKSVDEGTECLIQASESIQKLDKMIGNNNSIPIPPPFSNKKQFVSSANPTPSKKITTKLTLNLKKITGRSSDTSQLQKIQQAEQQTGNNVRHSICNSTELIKRLQVHLKGKDNTQSENDEISASCDNLVSRPCNDSKAKNPRVLCRNCGFSMIPAEILQFLQSQGGRISIASSVAESLPSVRYDESLQSLAAIRKWQQQNEARSTEDLYIDDDFCQGISQSLAANMELLPPPDFFDSLDFNILSAEIFHTQEHDYNDTLTGEENFNQIKGADEDANEILIEENTKCEVQKAEANKEKVIVEDTNEVPTCDVNDKQDIDEPKVDE